MDVAFLLLFHERLKQLLLDNLVLGEIVGQVCVTE